MNNIAHRINGNLRRIINVRGTGATRLSSTQTNASGSARQQWRQRRRARRFMGVLGVFGATVASIWAWETYMEASRPAESVYVKLLKRVPLRAFSSAFGYVADLPVPRNMRVPIYSAYSWVFGCRLDELDRPLAEFQSVGEFFARPLKPGVRPIAGTVASNPQNSSSSSSSSSHGANTRCDSRRVSELACNTAQQTLGVGLSDVVAHDANTAVLCSPVDGTVLHFGQVDELRRLEQIKGMTFTLAGLLGGGERSAREEELRKRRETSGEQEVGAASNPDLVTDLYCGKEPVSKARRLYFCTLYLSPGDYHGIHAPAPMTIQLRRHMPGHLLPVSSLLTRTVPSLFTINERVALFGEWSSEQSGPGGLVSSDAGTENRMLMALVAVGATDVGNIKVPFDRQLQTNGFPKPSGRRFDREFEPPIQVGRGDKVASFSLGSTVVMVFEASDNFRFTVEPEQHLLYGQKLGLDSR